MPHTHDNSEHIHNESQNILWAFALNAGFAILEFIGGLYTNSVAILSDALHDFGDSLALALAWILDRVSKKERDAKFTYGYKRFSLLGAMVNVIILVGGSIWILIQAIPRILEPQVTRPPEMIVLSLIGVSVNLIAVSRLRKNSSLNARVVALHLLEDMFGWIAVFIMSIVLLFTQFYMLDAILSVIITIFILYHAIKNMKKAGSLFLQAIPEEINAELIENEILGFPSVLSVHHTHCWSLDGVHHVLTSHIVLDDKIVSQEIVDLKCQIREKVLKRGFVHITLETEFKGEHCSMGGK